MANVGEVDSWTWYAFMSVAPATSNHDHLSVGWGSLTARPPDGARDRGWSGADVHSTSRVGAFGPVAQNTSDASVSVDDTWNP